MKIVNREEIVGVLENARCELTSLNNTTENEIRLVSTAFERLTHHTDTILHLTAELVASAESESVTSVLSTVRGLAEAANRFIEQRLQAAKGVLETVAAEGRLLRQLSLATREQAVIARKTKALSVLTNIEVARLGSSGRGFEHLARQLADFSQSLSDDVQRLAHDTDTHRLAIEASSHSLSAELPRQRQTMARIAADLEKAVAAAESGLARLSSTPATFRAYMDDLRKQISGVIAAVQAQDITRQQIEHVQEALMMICQRLAPNDRSDRAAGQNIAWACAGLTIQIYQLRKVKENVASWSSQIKTCMEETLILRVSARRRSSASVPWCSSRSGRSRRN